jgi:hypothetical protein
MRFTLFKPVVLYLNQLFSTYEAATQILKMKKLATHPEYSNCSQMQKLQEFHEKYAYIELVKAFGATLEETHDTCVVTHAGFATPCLRNTFLDQYLMMFLQVTIFANILLAAFSYESQMSSFFVLVI